MAKASMKKLTYDVVKAKKYIDSAFSQLRELMKVDCKSVKKTKRKKVKLSEE